MKEIVFRYGENDRGLGMITLPAITEDAPIVIMLNAGLLHRAEPYRLNVLACRLLAEIGYICLRVDLSGKGDTPSRSGLTNRESVALDWDFIRKSLEHKFGKRNLVLFGLCSGADNIIKIAAADTDIIGLILLDAVAIKDKSFATRDFLNKITNTSKWLDIHNVILRKFNSTVKIRKTLLDSPTSLRDEPTEDDLRKCFENLVSKKGRVLAIFTSHALTYYNEKGQFCRTIAINGLDKILEEVFWPKVEHLYTVQTHRDQLLDKIRAWGTTNFIRFQKIDS